MSSEESGQGTGEHGNGGGNNHDAHIDAYLEAWLHHAAKRRQENIEPERLQRLEREMIDAGRQEGLFVSAHGSVFERIRVLLFGAGMRSSAKSLVVGRGRAGHWRRWLLAVVVLLGLTAGVWLIKALLG